MNRNSIGREGGVSTYLLLMKCEFVSQNGQMELPVSTNVSFKRVTGVVSATTPPIPKLEQKSNLPNGNEWTGIVMGIFLECQYVYFVLPM